MPEQSELQRRRWYVLAVVSMSTFMTPFDGSIIAVALPAMGDSLQLSYSYALWAQAAYLLVTTALLIPAGRTADSRGPIRYNLAGNIVFALGSALAGLAQSGLVLIAGRCIQGAGGAFMFATSTGIITAVFPRGQRGKAIGINLTAGYVGLMAGPAAGGFIVARLDWRWVFFINLPIAVAVLAAGWTLMSAERRERHATPAIGRGSSVSRRSADWPAPLLLAAFLTALFIPLTFSPLWGWSSGRTVCSLLAAAAFLVAFVVREGRAAQPMLDLDLLRGNRVFAVACSAAFIYSVGMFASITLTAVFVQVVQGRSAEQAGLVLLVQPVLMVLISPIAGRLSDRIGARPLTCLGGLLLSAGMIQLALGGSSIGRILLGLATVGVGMALFSSPNMSAIMGAVPHHQLNLGSGFQAAMRFGGQGFSIAILGSIAAWKLGPLGAQIIFLGDTASAGSASDFADGYQLAMLVGAGLLFLAALLSWLARPTRRPRSRRA
jgi:EmrB/QacA subfamily drug resistance transporter